MSDAERVALGTTLAGKNQYKVLASVMSNFSTATEATTAALNSSGSAARENAKYMESIESKVNAVSAAFQQMSTKVVDSDLVKGILDIVKAMAEFGGTDFGAAVTQFVLLSGLSWGGLQLLGQSILPGIISSFENLARLRAGETLASLTKTGTAFAGALSVSLPYILAVTAAIVGLVAVIKAVKEAYDKSNPSIEQAALNMKNAQGALKQTETSYNNAKNKLEELNATPYEDRTSEIQTEIDELQTLVDYYETLLGLRGAEASEATAKYISTVEKRGLGVGQFQGTTQYSTYDNEGNLIYVDKLTEKYHSLTAAVQAAAKAQYEIDKTVIDITDISAAQKQLERLGWSFDEVTISVDKVQQSLTYYGNTMENNGKMTTAYMDDYQDLIALSEDYVVALENQQKQGVKLTDEQLKFIEVYRQSQKAYEEYITTQAEAQNVTKEEILSRYEAATALSAYAQELINAANAYQIFKDRLSETGDYDDSFKGFSSILSEVISEFDAGQIGSQAFLTGLELLTGQTMTSTEAVEYMNTHLDTLKTLFEDSESGGMGLITKLQELGYTTVDANGNLQISVENFAKLAHELGISEGALYSLTEALRVMGIDFQYNIEDILTNIDGLKEGITFVQDGITHVDFEAFVSQAQALGMANDEILVYKNLLEQAANTKLDNIEAGMEKLQPKTEDANSEVEGLDSALEGLNDFDSSGVVGSIDAISNALSRATSKAGELDGALGGIDGVDQNAEGTTYAKEGLSLVNEEGAELIQSRDKAYIAGGGLPTVTRLHQGDIVYTAKETKRILGNNRISGVIQSHKGTFDTSGGLTPPPAITGIVGVVPNGNRTGGVNGGGSSSSSVSSTDIKAEFDAWLKAKKHALAMDEITEEQYYKELAQMNDKYFKGKKDYQDEYWKYQEQIYSWEKKQEEERAKEAEKLAEELKKSYQNEFSSWLKVQDHALAMDEITQEEYYEALEAMNDQYFKDKEEYQEEYWKYEEKIYAWRKKQAEEEVKAQEQALKDQIELEKKLNNLAQAQASKVKIFQNGQFRYVSDREALAKAQASLSGYANGTLSASGGLSIVGEHGAEMRVLNKGDGVLPSNITKNLWDWGSISPNSLNRNNSEIYNFDINDISLPNVKDANNFVNGLKSFALQYVTQRGI